jgi:hypothetical protein
MYRSIRDLATVGRMLGHEGDGAVRRKARLGKLRARLVAPIPVAPSIMFGTVAVATAASMFR